MILKTETLKGYIHMNKIENMLGLLMATYMTLEAFKAEFGSGGELSPSQKADAERYLQEMQDDARDICDMPFGIAKALGVQL